MAGKKSSSKIRNLLPREPIHRLTEPLRHFLHIEAASGVVLLIATVAALALANSPWAGDYAKFWKTPVGFTFGEFEFRHPLYHLVNDGLMAIFFFVIGLEVKREIVHGELRSIKQATLPVAAAIGGMVAPAGLYLALQWGQPGERGWGIPMATDIAFVVGCMAVLGSRVPHGLRIMLLTLAIADDIGAILVIAIGYTDTIHYGALAWGMGGIVATWLSARLGVRSLLVYTVLGVLVWFGFHESGIHATIGGVILGLMTPAKVYLPSSAAEQVSQQFSLFVHGEQEEQVPSVEEVRNVQKLARESVPPSEYLEKTLHPWVGFVIMPVFALANAGVPVDAASFTSPIALAVVAGLVVGKPLGIALMSLLMVKLGWGKLPARVTWGQIVAGGCLAGIGFTMSLFVASLALKEESLLSSAKVGVLCASAISAVLGMTLLLALGKRAKESE